MFFAIILDLAGGRPDAFARGAGEPAALGRGGCGVEAGGKYLLLGRGEERSGGRTKTALLANAMEAVIGAIYLDAGLEAARKLIEVRVIAPALDRCANN